MKGNKRFGDSLIDVLDIEARIEAENYLVTLVQSEVLKYIRNPAHLRRTMAQPNFTAKYVDAAENVSNFCLITEPSDHNDNGYTGLMMDPKGIRAFEGDILVRDRGIIETIGFKVRFLKPFNDEKDTRLEFKMREHGYKKMASGIYLDITSEETQLGTFEIHANPAKRKDANKRFWDEMYQRCLDRTTTYLAEQKISSEI